MWRRILIMSAVATALSVSAAANADARRNTVGANVGVSAHSRMAATHNRGAIHTRAQMRGPQFRPPGWSHGRKTGWHCRVGTRGCIPPGLR